MNRWIFPFTLSIDLRNGPGGGVPGAAGAASPAPGPCGGVLGRRRGVHAAGGSETEAIRDGDLRILAWIF